MVLLKRLGLRALTYWLFLALTVLLLFAAVTRPVRWQIYYAHAWLLGVGLPLWYWRHPVTAWLGAWKVPEACKMIVLGYGMVLLEEVLAAFFNHLTEGFQLQLYLIRIGQFWAFNLFAFSGLIFATTLLYLKVGYSRSEMFVLTGLTALYSEKIIFVLVSAPLVFAVGAPVDFAIYGLIFSPALMSVPPRRDRRFSSVVRYLLFFAVWLVFTLPFILLLAWLRARYPHLFPPAKFI